MSSINLLPDRHRFARLYYGLVLIYIAHRYFNHMLLSQLQQPQLMYPGTDLTYIFFSWSGVTQFVTGKYWAALGLDILLAVSALTSFIFTRQKISSWVFTTTLFVYIVAGYSVLCFHKHNLTGLWFASLMFLATGETAFSLLFEMVRMYAVFTYASAGFWKFFRGVWNYPGHFPLIVKNDALAYLAQHPDTLLAKILSWLIIHPALLDNMMVLSSFIQISFVIGFFTKRLDKYFLLYALTFHLLSLLLLRAYFFEFSAILITLLPVAYFYKPAKTEP
ncbi:MAG: hypothetical protein RLZZ367_1691 [Bacteroidota bacterium]